MFPCVLPRVWFNSCIEEQDHGLDRKPEVEVGGIGLAPIKSILRSEIIGSEAMGVP
jgi:hypothetical protein